MGAHHRIPAAFLLAASACLASFGCGDPVEGGVELPLGDVALPGAVRPGLASHKVRVDATQAATLRARGAELVGDYGAFSVLRVKPELLPQVVATPGSEVVDASNDLLLNAGALDTTSAVAHRRPVAKEGSSRRLSLVQFAGPVKPEWYRALRKTGARVVAYIPNNAYLVQGEGDLAARLASLGVHPNALQWVGDYLPSDRLDPSVALHASGYVPYSIQLIDEPSLNVETLALVRALHDESAQIDEQRLLGYVNLVATLTRADVERLAQQPDVVSIQPRPEFRLTGERAAMILANQVSNGVPTGPGYLDWLESKGFTQAQFDASGFGVVVNDSGIDNGTIAPNHFSLYTGGSFAGDSRVVFNRLEGTPNGVGSTLMGCDGHGTLNAHLIGAYTDRAGAPHVDAEGYAYNLGVAPFVRLGSTVVFDPSSFTRPDYANMFARAFADAMRISNNSWGSSQNTYTTDAQQFDALVRDAQPDGSAVPNPGNQQMVTVVAAGTRGPSLNSVGSPGTAKNVLTVGANENVQPFGAPDRCGIEDLASNNREDLVTFSSRGPTSDGRFKPDLVAPGTHLTGGAIQADVARDDPDSVPDGKAHSCFDAVGVCGGVSDNAFFPSDQQFVTASSGPSHSAALASGAAALLRQHFLNQGLTAPSPAMTKAYLMNGARYLTGVGANDTLPSNAQGHGQLNLERAFDDAGRLLEDEAVGSLLTATGQTRTFHGAVADPSVPLRVTLAWTDAPGSTSGAAWNNDLDLTVTVDGETYLGNVFTGAHSVTGGTADQRNNVESVFLPAGVTGAFTVTVTAANINSDGVPNNDSPLDQDFALVVYNACTQTGAVPTGVAATATADNEVTVSWNDNGATLYVVERSIDGGAWTTVGSSEASPFVDTGLNGGATVRYVVRARACADSELSEEASVVVTGDCLTPPAFDGLETSSPGRGEFCSTTLAWSPATPSCNGAVTYSVYRGTEADFVPGPLNRLATGLVDTYFVDDRNLVSGTPYHYVVRATENSSVALDDANLVRVDGGALLSDVTVTHHDDFGEHRPEEADAYWSVVSYAGSVEAWNIVEGCQDSPSGRSYRFGPESTDCGGTYPPSHQSVLVFGGDGSTPGIGGFKIPEGATGSLTLSIRYDLQERYDGVLLAYNTTSAVSLWEFVGESASSSAPFITSGGYDDALMMASSLRVWTGTSSRQVVVDVSALAGRTVWFGLYAISDESEDGNGAGFFLDDVSLSVDTQAACATHEGTPGPAVTLTGTHPDSAAAGEPVSFSFAVRDAAGTIASDFSGDATLTSTDPLVTLPQVVSFQNGVATVDVAFVSVGQVSLSLAFTDADLPPGTFSLQITPALLSALLIDPVAETVVAGAPFGATVRGGNVFGQVLPLEREALLSLQPRDDDATLSGTLTLTPDEGAASVDDLSITRAGTGYRLVASADGLTAATSAPFAVLPAAPAAVSFLSSPGVAPAGLLEPVKVVVRDAFGNRVDTPVSVTLTLDADAVLGGTTTVNAVNGIATFDALEVTAIGTGYVLVATVAALPEARSAAFDVVAAAPSQLVLVSSPSEVVAGEAFTVSVSIQDASGNVSLAAQGSLVVSATAGLTGELSASPVDGIATFTTLALTQAGDHVLEITLAGLPALTTPAITVEPAAAATLAFASPPASIVAGSAFSPPVAVAVRDAFGNTVTAARDIAVSLAGATLEGTPTAQTLDGVASFAALTVHRAGEGYTLTASTDGVPPVTSDAFDVTSAPAASFVVTLAETAQVGKALPVTAVAFDAFGNQASDFAGQVEVTSSDAALRTSGPTAFVAGELTGLEVTFQTAGEQTLVLTSSADATVSGEASITVAAAPVTPATPEEPEEPADEGCGCGGGASAHGVVLFGLVALALRRRTVR